MRVYDLRNELLGGAADATQPGQKIFRVVGAIIFFLILIILYAPFFIMGLLSFAGAHHRRLSTGGFLVDLLPEAVQPE